MIKIKKSLTIFLLVTEILVANIASSPGAETSKQTAQRYPEYQVLRQEEDWSFLANVEAEQKKDWFDSIKYIPLNQSGSIWLGFGGQARLRVESWNNFNFGAPEVASTDATFPLFRLLFQGDLHLGDHARVFLQGKSAVAGDRDLPGGRRPADYDQLDLQNGFFDIIDFSPLDDLSMTFRGGRQELLFGKQRLVGPLDWANSRRTFDGASAIFYSEGWKSTAFWSSLVQLDSYDFNQPDVNADLYGIYSSLQVLPKLMEMDLYWLGVHHANAVFNGTGGTEDRQTFGIRIWGEGTSIDWAYELEGAYQLGDIGSADISAFMIMGWVGYAFPDVFLAPALHLEFDYASGDSKPGDGRVETFNQLYPTGHPFLGYIDTVGRQNIVDITGGVALHPYKSLALTTDIHRFWRASTEDALYNAAAAVVRAGSAGRSSSVGTEIDFTASCLLNRHLSALFGYSHFFAGQFIEESGPSKDIDFIYLSFQFTF